MMKRTVLSLPLIALAVLAGVGIAQSQEPAKASEPQKFYRLEFVVKEVEGGKVLNARSYSMIAAADAKGNTSIRTGTRFPYQVAGGGYQFVEVGVNIDCRGIQELQRDLSLFVSAEITSVPSEPTGSMTLGGNPLVRQNRWSSSTIVPLKKPTVIFSSDDLVSKRQMQLDLTATPIT